MIRATHDAAVDAIYECHKSMRAFAQAIGQREDMVYRVLVRWCKGGECKRSVPRGVQTRLIVKSVNQLLDQRAKHNGLQVANSQVQKSLELPVLKGGSL